MQNRGRSENYRRLLHFTLDTIYDEISLSPFRYMDLRASVRAVSTKKHDDYAAGSRGLLSH